MTLKRLTYEDPTMSEEGLKDYSIQARGSDNDNILVDTGQLIGITLASAGASILNTPSAIGNAFGGDFESVANVKSLIPQSWEDDYSRDKESFDLAGEIIGSIVPGIGTLTLARKLARGTKGIGRIFDTTYTNRKQAAVVRTALKDYRATGTFNKAEVFQKSLGWGAAAGVAEGVAFEIGAYGSTVLLKDMQNEDLEAMDVILRAGKGIIGYGGAFGGALGGIGGAAKIGSKVRKRLGRVSTVDGLPQLSAAADTGSRIVQSRVNINTINGRKLTPDIDKATQRTNQEAIIDNDVAQMVGDEHLFTAVSLIAKQAPDSVVRTLFTGTTKMSTVKLDDLGETIVTKPKELPAYMKPYMGEAAEDAVESPLMALQRRIAAGDPSISGEVKTFMQSGKLHKFFETTSYVNLVTGARTLSLKETYLADLGKITIGDTGKFLRVGNGDSLHFATSSAEVKRILLRDTLLKGKNLDLPKKPTAIADNPELYEAAYVKYAKVAPEDIPKAAFPEGVETMQGLEQVLLEYKETALRGMIKDGASEAAIERTLGLSLDLIHNGSKSVENVLTIGTHNLTHPRHVRIESNPVSFSLDQQLAIAWDKRVNGQLVDFAHVTGLNYLQRTRDAMPTIAEDLVQTALNTGAKALKSATAIGNYLGGEQAMAAIGKITELTSRARTMAHKQAFESIELQMKENRAGSLAFIHMRDWYDRSGKVILDNGVLIRTENVATYVKEGAEALTEGVEYYVIKDEAAKGWATKWHEIATDIGRDKYRLDKAAGKQPSFNQSHFYLPPKAIKFGAMVFDPKGAGGNAKVGMLRANSAADLKALVHQLADTHPDLSVRSIDDINSYYNATSQFDISRSFSKEIDSSLQRKGNAGNVIANVDAEQLVTDLQAHISAGNSRNARQAVKLTYVKEFSILEDLHIREGAAARSATGANVDRFSVQNTDAGNAMKTLLNIPPELPFEGLSVANRNIEKFASRYFNKAKLTLSKVTGRRSKDLLGENPQQFMKQVNELYEKEVGTEFKQVSQLIEAANPDVDKAQLQSFLSKLNGYQAMLMLRADGLDGLVNNISAAVLGSNEIKTLMKELAPEAAEDLRKLVTLSDGKGLEELSPMKSILRGFKLMGNLKEKAAKIEQWKKEGRWTSTDEAFELLAHKLSETAEGGFKDLKTANKELSTIMDKVKSVAFFASDKLNDHAQLQVLNLIDDIAEVTGMSEGLKFQLTHTMKGRVLGMNIPSQKPTMFQGVLGTPVSLYQNYNLNVINSMLRYAGEKGQLARFGLMQTGAFGLQGLPGFEQLNSMIHETYAREEGLDLKSIIHNTAGTEAGNWMLYGSGSVAIDAAIHSRGDLNQRNKFIFPSPSEVPTVRTATNLATAAGRAAARIVNGTPATDAIFDGLAHSQLNRPMTGIIDTLRGFSTTAHGKLAQQNNAEELSWRANVSRLLGARPFEEALLRERQWKLGSYQTETQHQMNSLSSSITLTMLNSAGKGLTQGQYDRFFKKFLQLGKSPEDFDKWFARVEDNHSKDAVERLERKIKSSKYYEQYNRYFNP